MGRRGKSKTIPVNHSKFDKFLDSIPDDYLVSGFCLIFLPLYLLLFSAVPNFIGDIYLISPLKEQPISDFFNVHVPISRVLLGGIAIGWFAVAWALNGVETIAALCIGVWLIVDTPSVSLLTVSTASALQANCVALAVLCAMKCVASIVFSRFWWLCLCLSWFFGFASLVFNVDSIGIILILVLLYTFTGFSWAWKVNRNRYIGEFLLKFGKYSLASMGIGTMFGCLAAAVIIRFNVVVTIAFPNVAELIEKAREMPTSIALIIVVFCSFVGRFLLKTDDNTAVFIIIYSLSAIVSIFIPLQSQGDTLIRKLVYFRILMIVVSAWNIGWIKNVWYSRGIAFLGVIILFIGRVVYLRAENEKSFFDK